MMNPTTVAAILAYYSLLSASAPVPILHKRDALHLAGPEPEFTSLKGLDSYFDTRESSDGNSWVLKPKNYNPKPFNKLTDVQPVNMRFATVGSLSDSELRGKEDKPSKSKHEGKEKSSKSEHEEEEKSSESEHEKKEKSSKSEHEKKEKSSKSDQEEKGKSSKSDQEEKGKSSNSGQEKKEKSSKSDQEKKEKSSKSDHEAKEKSSKSGYAGKNEREREKQSSDPVPADTVPEYELRPWVLDSRLNTRSVVPEYDWAQYMPDPVVKEPVYKKESHYKTHSQKEDEPEHKGQRHGKKKQKSKSKEQGQTQSQKEDETEHKDQRHGKKKQKSNPNAKVPTGPVPVDWRIVPHNRGTFGPFDPGFYGP